MRMPSTFPLKRLAVVNARNAKSFHPQRSDAFPPTPRCAGHAVIIGCGGVPGPLFAERMSDRSAPPIARRLCWAGQRTKVHELRLKHSWSLHEAREGSDAQPGTARRPVDDPTKLGAPIEWMEGPHSISFLGRVIPGGAA